MTPVAAISIVGTVFPSMIAGALLIFGGAVLWNLKPEGARARSFLRAASALFLLMGMGVYLWGLRGYAEKRRARPADKLPGQSVSLSEENARAVLAGAERFERRDASTIVGYRRGSGGEEIREFAVWGKGDGYVPGIEVVVAVSSDKKILRLQVTAHGETPSFMGTFRRGGFVERLVKKDIADEFEIGKDLDAVSGATHTSEGVAMAVRSAVKSPQLGLAMQPPPTLLAVPNWKALAACGYLLLLAVFLPRLGGKLRLACLGVSIGVLGVLAGRLFAVSDFARASTGLLPAGQAGAGALLFLLTLVIVTLWRGRMWCSHACPFGALCELGGKLTRAKSRPLKSLPWIPVVLPWIMMAAVALGIAWTGKTVAAGAEPFGITAQLLSWPPNALKLWRASRVPLATFALILAISLFVTRFYCRNLCGAGLLLRILTRVRALSRPSPESSLPTNDQHQPHA